MNIIAIRLDNLDQLPPEEQAFMVATMKVCESIICDMTRLTAIVHKRLPDWKDMTSRVAKDFPEWLIQKREMFYDPESVNQFLADLVLWTRDRTEHHLGVERQS